MRQRHGGLSEVSQVKCPRCGFVSSPSAVCERCGLPFAADELRSGAEQNASSFSILDAPLLPDATLASQTSQVSMQGSGQPWQDEIAERVARYRRRKSQVHGAEDSASSNLEFDFNSPHEIEARGPTARGVEEFDAVLANNADSQAEAAALDSVPIKVSLGASLPAEADAGWAAEPVEAHIAGPAPVQVVLGPSFPEKQQPGAITGDEVRLAAPIGRRLAAALVDGLVLLIAACLFTLVFAKTGGKAMLPASDITVIVLGLATAFLVTFYFALFTALAFATPGQSALGLRVRTLDNRLPGTGAAAWRGVGYVVSAAALMLGFIWAVFRQSRPDLARSHVRNLSSGAT